ncbi:hypothetical protein A1OO_12585 [Enterovibrio norvegicus FF-33]|uniref:Uncharacterized protein n=1 Tax=Enterovibrio norvegicus FF-454 TaxID=1185651 RepID=A0A1E5C8H4_9GAMM|nr:hypothetical protein [Enterovibrio norvegicus]OEE61808.1 hypothetical protein A1OK_08600 [Enterovibrio norvegicus FF-454]OEE66605.1 hypothetical protein A1OO_12585 [Enterovibrio norvegicus FF-33]OEE77628.1 hypothetical protein A1OQ_00865 [Enterovibrio norvegicus FF-162]
MPRKDSLLSRTLICGILVFTSIMPIWFAQVNADPIPKTLQEVFIDATSGVSGAGEHVLSAVDSLLRQYPEDALLTAYYGSTLYVKARDSWLPWDKEKYSTLGMASLNKSLRLLSNESFSKPYYGLNEGIYIQSIAAITFVNTPDLLHQKARGYNMLKNMLASEQLQYYPFEPQAWIHLGAVKAALDMEEPHVAQAWAQEMRKLAPTHPLTQEALSLTANTNA